MLDPLIIYHADCDDGFGAAFAAWRKFGSAAEYLPMRYEDREKLDVLTILPQPRTREVYVLDFSFSMEMMTRLAERADRLVWLDHHKTAFEMVGHDLSGSPKLISGVWPPADCESGAHYVRLDNERSGAYLAWQYFHPGGENIPSLIQCIDDYDRWQFKLPGTREVIAALRSYQPYSFLQWEELLQTSADSFLQQGVTLLRAHKVQVAQLAANARDCAISASGMLTRFGLAVNGTHHLASDLGHALAIRRSSYGEPTFGLVWYQLPDGMANCSLRSTGNYDVSVIAEKFGGGGHRNAAGFRASMGELLSWLR